MEIKPGYKQTEIGVIPEDWCISKLGSSFPLQRGFDLPQSKAKEGSYPVVYSNGILNFHNQFMCKAQGVVTGRSGTIGRVFFIDVDYWPHNTTLWVTSFKGNNPKFVYYLLSYLHTEKYGTGSGVPTLNRNDLHDLIVPLPPEPEQRLISSALTNIDSLITSLEKLFEKKKLIKQGVMQELLTGIKRLPGFSGEWEASHLGKVVSFCNGYAFKSSSYKTDGQYSVLTIANVQDGFIDPITNHFIDTLPSDLQPHHLLNKGDILISMTGNVGRIGVVMTDNMLLNQRVGKLLPHSINPAYLFYTLHDSKFRTTMISAAQGGAQDNIGKDDILNYPIFLPDKEEQEAISIAISQVDKEIVAIANQVSKYRLLKQAMMQELLTGRIRLI